MIGNELAGAPCATRDRTVLVAARDSWPPSAVERKLLTPLVMGRSVTLLVLCGVVACSGSNSDVGRVSGGAGAGGASGGASGNGATSGGGASSAGKGGASAEGGVANAGGPGSLAGSAGASGSALGGAGGTGGASGASGFAGAGALAGASGSSGASGGASFAQVQAIFDNHCVLCHDKSKLGLPSYPALSLVQGDARAALVNRSALETCGGTYVVPGKPEQSYLIHKLSDSPPCEGARMPAGFEILKPPTLSVAELVTIAGWISAGAR